MCTAVVFCTLAISSIGILKVTTIMDNDKNKGQEIVSASYKKYGVNVPSISSIMQDIEDTNKFVASIKKLENCAVVLKTNFEKTFVNKEDNKVILDCKHISDEEITSAFEKNLSYITEIFKGIRYSKRHDLFQTNANLIHNTSMITFTLQQKGILMRLMRQTFGNAYVDYFLKVLLPELCLKIFMDEHKMTNEEAVKYLAERPVV